MIALVIQAIAFNENIRLPIEPAAQEEYEPLREYLAMFLAEGSMIQVAPGAKLYQLTPKG